MGISWEREVTESVQNAIIITTVVALEPHSAPDVPGGVSGPGFPAGLPSPEDGLCWSQHTAVKLMFALLIDINDLPFTAQHPCSTHPH